MERSKQLIIVRGAGDIATGTIYKLCRCGFPVLALEAERPSAIRREAAFSEAVYEGQKQVEDMTCYLVNTLEQAWNVMRQGSPAILKDPDCTVLEEAAPWALVDAILAKRNLGTHMGMAEKTIALGPGFLAGRDVNLVIETMRGHDLGRVITRGYAMENTGIPGKIAGYDRERVVYAPAGGKLHALCGIGSSVIRGQIVAEILTDGEEASSRPVPASLDGIIRGMLREGYPVTKGMKMADIDPRAEELKNCYSISDKARCIAGAVLEGLLYLEHTQTVQET